MKNLLNFGVSDPLTLGMSHPVADRLETLGRSKPYSKGSRAAAFGIIGGLAVLSAPFTLAADKSAPKKAFKFEFVSTESGLENQSFEVVNENGEERAYAIAKNGERVPAQLETLANGNQRILLPDGQTIDLPNFSDLEHSKVLGELAAFQGFEDFEKLKTLGDLEGFAQLSALKDLEIDGDELSVFVSNAVRAGEELSDEILAGFPEHVRDLVSNAKEAKQIKILKNGETETFNFFGPNGDLVTLPDSVVDLNFSFATDDDPLRQALRQIERTERQLSKLAEDETLTFDLENAMRDLESARKSLNAAEKQFEQAK